MSDIDNRLSAIELRNARVEGDKAWETSWVRRGSIALTTYICAVVLLSALGGNGAWLNALVPVVGYVLSTLSLPVLKSVWLQNCWKGRGQS
ncbi:MAG: hypothetical protein JO126_08520 [Alphaproteobacteria bacterium]|nr:hypothetical protein [Alphaproteobacteria bacterium]MBV8549485.1 hypothetical protein [Alphaproteobacteria bacterium]